MTAVEVTSVDQEQLSGGQSSPLNAVIEQVTLEVRSAVRSCSNNVVSQDETLVPVCLIYHAVAIIRYRLLSRYGLVMDHGGESRLEEHRAAQRQLKLVAQCDIIIERAPDAEAPIGNHSCMEVLNSNPHPTVSRDSLSGL